MPRPRTPADVLQRTAELYLSHNRSLKNAAAQSGVGYQTFVSRIRLCKEQGLLDDSPSLVSAAEVPVKEQKTIVIQNKVRLQPRKSNPEETKRVLAIGDCHDGPSIPDKSRFYAMGAYARINKVDQIIQIGDIATCDSLNRFDRNDTLKGRQKPAFKDDMFSLQQAVRAFDKGLKKYDVPKHITLGNHEDRIWSFTNRNPETVELLDQLLYSTIEDHGWTYSPYGEMYFIGDVGFTHTPMNGMGKPYGGMHCENQIARDSLHDVVFGHTHKRLDKTFPKIGAQFLNVINLGCSLPEGHVEEYAKHSLTGWSYGVYDLSIVDGKIEDRTWVPMTKLMREYANGYTGDN